MSWPSEVGRRTGLRVVSAFALLIALLGPAAAPVLGHALLLGADPADGSVLTQAPERIRLVFTQAVAADLSTVELVASSGQPIPVRVDRRAGQLVGHRPRAPQPAGRRIPRLVEGPLQRRPPSVDGHARLRDWDCGVLRRRGRERGAHPDRSGRSRRALGRPAWLVDPDRCRRAAPRRPADVCLVGRERVAPRRGVCPPAPCATGDGGRWRSARRGLASDCRPGLAGRRTRRRTTPPASDRVRRRPDCGNRHRRGARGTHRLDDASPDPTAVGRRVGGVTRARRIARGIGSRGDPPRVGDRLSPRSAGRHGAPAGGRDLGRRAGGARAHGSAARPSGSERSLGRPADRPTVRVRRRGQPRRDRRHGPVRDRSARRLD